MKWMFCFLVFVSMVTAGEVAAIPEIEKVVDFYARVEDRSRISGDRIDNFAKSNSISRKQVYEAVKSRIKYAHDIFKKTDSKDERSYRWKYMSYLIAYAGNTRDPEWIPFFEEFYVDAPKSIRTQILRAYIWTDVGKGLDFTEKAFDCDEIDHRDYLDIWTRLQRQYTYASKHDQKIIVSFLLRRMEKATRANDVEDIDKALTTHVPEYRTSMQRKKYVEKFLKSGNDYTANLGRKIAEEIEKTPPAKRADLSELLKKPKNEAASE